MLCLLLYLQDSLGQAQRWLQELRQENSLEDVVVMLVGNKADLGSEREITFQVCCTLLRPSPMYTHVSTHTT